MVRHRVSVAPRAVTPRAVTPRAAAPRAVTPRAIAALVSGAALALGCAGPPSAPARAEAAVRAEPARAPAAPAGSAPGQPEEPARLTLRPTSLRALPVPEHRDAVVSDPGGHERDARPVLVALHGNFDRPEGDCARWRAIVGERPFILCVRGIPRADAPRDDRWHYGALGDVEAEIEAGLTALGDRHGEAVDVRRPVLVGFSLGAILGRMIVARAPERWAAAVLVEGGREHEVPARLAASARAGGLRWVVACGQDDCAARARQAARPLGAGARVLDVKGAGHRMDGAMAEALREAWPWVAGGDPRFAAGGRAPLG